MYVEIFERLEKIEESIKNIEKKININKVYKDETYNIFKDGIRKSIERKRPPTRKMILNRKPRLRCLDTKQWNELVETLKNNGEIFVENTDKNTKYWLSERR